MQVPLDGHDATAGTITWTDPETGKRFETPVTGGRCKLQWKPDWAMRWYALDVDYEMAGKDLIDSVKLSGRIVRALGGTPPDGFNYELFLDEKGQKISKSKGNGLTIDEWLTYASPESLSVFMFARPIAAKRLFFDVIPRAVDDYGTFLAVYPRQSWKERLGNPVWHLHNGVPPVPEVLGNNETVSFAMLLNLASVANSDDPAVLWSFLPALCAERLAADAIRASTRWCAMRRPIIATSSCPRSATARPTRRNAPCSHVSPICLGTLPKESSPEDIQTALYDLARGVPRYQTLTAKGATPERPGVSNDFFNMLYQVLLGEDRGPRFGSFAALYGLDNTRRLIDDALAGKLTNTLAEPRVADHIGTA